MPSSRNKPIPTSGLVSALIYTRVSSDEQRDEGVSLAAQLRQCRQYVAGLGGAVIGGEFSDVLSGKHDARPGYVALLAEAERRAKLG